MTTPPAVPYSVFSASEKRLITALIGCAMLFSPLSANIYFPCLNPLQDYFHVTPQLINLTITSYVLLQGIAPALFGDLADLIGRRPVYLITFVVYMVANLGLALQGSYAGLLILRMLQSLGCSATVAIGYGVVADLATPAERGRILGPAMVATNLGPSLGPLIGGLLADRAGWRWVFWFLAILGGAFLMVLLMVFPETGRNIVGNGSFEAIGWSRTLYSCLYPCRSDKKKRPLCERVESNEPKSTIRFPNPLRSVKIIFHRDTGLALFMSANFYTVYYCTQASIPGFFKDIYGLKDWQIGVSYLAIGIGVVLGGFVNGKFSVTVLSVLAVESVG